jgi:hypothetical protein
VSLAAEPEGLQGRRRHGDAISGPREDRPEVAPDALVVVDKQNSGAGAFRIVRVRRDDAGAVDEVVGDGRGGGGGTPPDQERGSPKREDCERLDHDRPGQDGRGGQGELDRPSSWNGCPHDCTAGGNAHGGGDRCEDASVGARQWMPGSVDDMRRDDRAIGEGVECKTAWSQ